MSLFSDDLEQKPTLQHPTLHETFFYQFYVIHMQGDEIVLMIVHNNRIVFIITYYVGRWNPPFFRLAGTGNVLGPPSPPGVLFINNEDLTIDVH